MLYFKTRTMKKYEIISEVTSEMVDWFEKRTNAHIALVQKYIKEIQNLALPELDNNILDTELYHDAGKFKDPERDPYVCVTWKYKQERDKKEYKPSTTLEAEMHAATYHHVKTHKHHPEYWDDTTTPDSINPVNRDKKPKNPVDATKMPLSYVAVMVADWCAVSEEKGTSVKDWIKNNVNIRWVFTSEQVALINKIVGMLQGNL
jgi:hypothetical protein